MFWLWVEWKLLSCDVKLLSTVFLRRSDSDYWGWIESFLWDVFFIVFFFINKRNLWISWFRFVLSTLNLVSDVWPIFRYDLFRFLIWCCYIGSVVFFVFLLSNWFKYLFFISYQSNYFLWFKKSRLNWWKFWFLFKNLRSIYFSIR